MKQCLVLFLLLLTGVGCGRKTVSEEDKAAEVAAHKQKEQQLRDADTLVQKWADQAEKQAGNHVEGLTDLDPWGNRIEVTYHQEWFSEIATVRSHGPDGKAKTADDLVRTRSYSNPSGILKGISGWGWFGIIWILCGILAFAASAGVSHNRRSHGKSGSHRHPIAFAVIVILLAPLAAIIYGLQFIGGALGATGGFFDGFEFDFDIDL